MSQTIEDAIAEAEHKKELYIKYLQEALGRERSDMVATHTTSVAIMQGRLKALRQIQEGEIIL